MPEEKTAQKSQADPVRSLLGMLISFGAIGFTLLFLLFAIWGAYESYQHRTLFLTFCLVLTFAMKPTFKNQDGSGKFSWIDMLLIGLSVGAGMYGALQNYDILLREGEPIITDIWVGGLVILLTLEGTRRTMGLALPVIAGCFLLYSYFGPYFPKIVAHGGYALGYMIAANYMSDQGIYGIILGVTADFIFLFVLFGALLEIAGAVNHFNKISQSLMGHQVGGPAKTAVLASGFMGSISGSAVANVVTTGTFTIPLMRRMGYPPAFAAGVEAAASTGGQFMPPIMGASAFVIAATLGIPYLSVARGTLLPATLFFFSVGMGVHFMSKRLGLSGLPKKDLPPFLPSLRIGGPLLLPLGVIVYVLMNGYSIIMAGLWGILTVLMFSWFIPETRLTPRKIIKAFENAGKNIIGVGLACATAGLVANAIAITGLGMRVSSITVMVGEHSLYFALVFAMIACLILGMGMPTVAAYIIVSTLGAPALIDLGMHKLATHLFVFFFAIICSVTPPVALAAYAAAPLAGLEASTWRVGLEGFRLALAAFIIPFFFIFNQNFLLEGELGSIFLAIVTSLIGVSALSASTIGYFRSKCGWLARILLMASAFGLLYHNVWINAFSLVAVLFLYFLQKKDSPSSDASLSGA